MTRPPAITVAMAAYNAGDYLLPSVHSVIAQTFEDWELILVDDGSTDGSMDAVSTLKDDRIRIIRNGSNLGLIKTRNLHIELARAPLLAILDSDDIAYPHRLATQFARMSSDTDLALLSSSLDLIDDRGSVFGHIPVPGPDHAAIMRIILSGNPFAQCAVMLRTDAAKAVGGYPAGFPVAEDYALWLAMAGRYQVGNVIDPLVQYRVHGKQTSQTKIRLMREKADELRFAYWERWQGTPLGKVVSPPTQYSWRGQLRGRPTTLGADYLFWANLYAKAGRHDAALSTALHGLAAAPLCLELMAIVYDEVRGRSKSTKATQ